MRTLAFNLSSVVSVYISYKVDFYWGLDVRKRCTELIFTLSNTVTFFFFCLFLFYILKKWSHKKPSYHEHVWWLCYWTRQSDRPRPVRWAELEMNKQKVLLRLLRPVTRLVYQRVVCWSAFFVLEIASDETFTIFRKYRCVSVSQMLTKEARLWILSADYSSLCTNCIRVSLNGSHTDCCIGTAVIINSVVCHLLQLAEKMYLLCDTIYTHYLSQITCKPVKILIVKLQTNVERPTAARFTVVSETLLLNRDFVNDVNFLQDESAQTDSGGWIWAALILPLYVLYFPRLFYFTHESLIWWANDLDSFLRCDWKPSVFSLNDVNDNRWYYIYIIW